MDVGVTDLGLPKPQVSATSDNSDASTLKLRQVIDANTSTGPWSTSGSYIVDGASRTTKKIKIPITC